MERRLERLTYEQAVNRLEAFDMPGFWVGDVDGLEHTLGTLGRGTVSELARTPGGRPLFAVVYGQREDLPSQANFNSAVGGRLPAAYMDKSARRRPVVMFVGPVHGQEVENLTGLMNLIAVMETGKDRRGVSRPGLRELGERCRLIIVPAGNPDGIARFEPRCAARLTIEENAFWAMGTWADDRIAFWPESKRQHPSTEGFMGCYFNDAGINPMHDEFFAPMGPEAPAILDLARAEGPDVAVSLHSHSGAPALLRPAYVPLEVQERVAGLAETVYGALAEHGLPHGQPFDPGVDRGTPPPPFNLTSALYHTSGAMSFTFECPHGHRSDDRACRVTLTDILDIQLCLYESMLRTVLDGSSGEPSS